MSARRSYGTGSLHVREDANGNGTWHARWYAPGGQRVKRRIGPARAPGSREGLTRAQAEQEMRRLMAEVKPSAAAHDRIDIAEAGARYIAAMEARGRKASSISGVRSSLNQWLIPQLGGRALDEIQPQDVDDLMAVMRSSSRKRRQGGCAPKTIRNTIGNLSAIYNYARNPRRKWAASNPCDGVELPGQPEGRLRFLTPDELQAVAAHAIPGPYQPLDRVLYLAAGMTGLRQGELIALRWLDVDWPAEQVRVRENHVLGEFVAPKSNRSRSVPLAPALAGELHRWWVESGEPGEGALVFPDPLPRAAGGRTQGAGGPLGKPQVLRRFRDALAAAGLDAAMTFHELRHTFGTTMAAAGEDARSIQEWMGHADLATTQRYMHYAPRQDSARRIGEAFESRGPIRGPILSESDVTSEHLRPANTGDMT